MKKAINLFAAALGLLIVSISPSNAQSVAINTDGSIANASAILDIKSINKGVLTPRMTTAQRMAIASPAAGLFVYDTDTNGFWFYNGSAWTNLSSGTAGWLLTGNSGINPANNFIGTSDNQPLRIKINNTWAGELHPAGNIFFGIRAGQANSTGYSNIAIGLDALKSNTSGINQTAIGDSALFTNVTGAHNTALGKHSLFSNTTGNFNTGLGAWALFSNTTGDFNTAIGLNSLYNNIDGFENTAIGSRALQFNNSGFANTATGASALRLTTTGYANTATGYQSLNSNITGVLNTASGYRSLYLNTISNNNTANGAYALASNSTASENTAIGGSALEHQSYSNGGIIWKSKNTAVGYQALFLNQPTSTSEGIHNTAVGNTALYANNKGRSNTAIGHAALYANSGGYNNTAIGDSALKNNSDQFADNNTAIGYLALFNNISGIYNTSIGTQATNDGSNQNYNTIIGAGAHISNASNSVVIGYNSFTNTNNLALLGNPSTLFTGGYTAWSNFSDGRFKRNVSENVKGLDFILHLRPVTYQMDVKGLYNFWGSSPYANIRMERDEKSIAFIEDAIQKKESVVMTGFVAQEVEKAARDCGYNFDGVIRPQHNKDHYRISYAEFVVPLVKAVQEQQAIIEKQQEQIDLLLKRIIAIEKK